MTTPICVCAECGARNPAHADTCGQCRKPLNGQLWAEESAPISDAAWKSLDGKCHRNGEWSMCWRVQCNLGKRCTFQGSAHS